MQSGCHLKINKKAVPFCRARGSPALNLQAEVFICNIEGVVTYLAFYTQVSCLELQKCYSSFSTGALFVSLARWALGQDQSKVTTGVICAFKRGDRRGPRVWCGGCPDTSLGSPQPCNNLRHEHDYLPILQGRKQEARVLSKAQQGHPLSCSLLSAEREPGTVSERSSPRGLLLALHFI